MSVTFTIVDSAWPRLYAIIRTFLVKIERLTRERSLSHRSLRPNINDATKNLGSR